MKACHYIELESPKLAGGIATSAKQQRKALDEEGVNWTGDPSEDYDVLHLNALGPLSIYQMIKAKLKGKKVIYHTHTTVEDFEGSFKFSQAFSPLYSFYTRIVYNSSDLLISPSPYTKDLLKDKGVDTEIEVITNGYDREKLDGFEELEAEVREKYDAEGFTVVNLACVFERKGIDEYIHAARQLEEVNFVWFGKIFSYSPRETKKKVENAPENLEFAGFVDDKREAFALGDVFFFPSHDEHQPVALQEASYCAMPILLRDIPQYEGWFEDGENCLKADSKEGFVEELKKLKQDEELREKIAEGAKKESEKHSLDRVGEQLKNVYHRLAEE